MKRTRKLWTPAAVRTLRKLYASTPTWKIAKLLRCSLLRVYAKTWHLDLRKSAEYMAGPDACRLRRGGNSGAAFRFPKGHVPFNKGWKGVRRRA